MKFTVTTTIILLAYFASAQLPSYVPTSNLKGYYLYSGNILDNSTNGHNNANYNIVSTTDRFNNIMSALYFSGSGSEYVNYGDVDDFEPYQATFSFWINPENYGGSSSEQVKPIISKWSSPLDLIGSSYNIFMNGSDLCFVLTDAVVADTLTTSLSTIPLNQWAHVVITANYGFIKFYINNVLVTDTSTPISSFNNTNSEFKVGGWYQDIDPSFSSFTGKIDDLGIWNRELDACEVEALYTGVDCQFAGIEPMSLEKRDLIKIIDLLGRETDYRPNTPLVFIYSDGTRERMIKVE